ncbi:WD40-repeat-containing domain protein [Pilobolus umbonatus]|nr:WD40-repeat-containing domain protein [Pilobolus umbonatus]
MLTKTIEINWHDGQAIYSTDFSPDGYRYATAGADCSVRMWSLHARSTDNQPPEITNKPTHGRDREEERKKKLADSLPVNIDFLSELKRHSSPVNVVRFSPKGEYLASAGDDACIILWKLSIERETSFGYEYNDFEKETWSVTHMFYGHTKEIYDLSWSPCGKYFITASIDNTARVWCLAEKACVHVFADHSHYVQGVSWDPLGEFVATQSSDRSVAIYRYKASPQGKLIFGGCARRFSKLDRKKLSSVVDENTSGCARMYHDETLVSFFRRLSFSPDGALLVTPAGINKFPDTNTMTDDMDEFGEDLQNCAYIYPRNTVLKHPVALIGNHPKPSIAVRWCPMLFRNRRSTSSAFALPYRMLYALATQDSVYIYDTQQIRPICAISGMHFAPVTDLAWSADGSMLMFSSADGYCSAVIFADGELGIKYDKKPEAMEEEVQQVAVSHSINHSTVDDIIAKKRPSAIIAEEDKGKKRRITPVFVQSRP